MARVITVRVEQLSKELRSVLKTLRALKNDQVFGYPVYSSTVREEVRKGVEIIEKICEAMSPHSRDPVRAVLFPYSPVLYRSFLLVKKSVEESDVFYLHDSFYRVARRVYHEVLNE